MEIDGTFTEVTLNVTATVRLGQSLYVNGFEPKHDNTHVALGTLPCPTDCALISLPQAVPLITSPEDWPVWRTAQPLILRRNLVYMYRYCVFDGVKFIDTEPALSRSFVLRSPTELVQDVFGDVRVAGIHGSEALNSNLEVPWLNDTFPKSMAHIYIACFHLPVRLVRNPQSAGWIATWGESLIARTDGSVAEDTTTHWVGTVFAATDVDGLTAHEHDPIRAALRPLNCVPLFFPDATRDRAYLGYCKQVLWPSFHNVDILDMTCACWKPSCGDPASVWDQAATEHWWDAYVALNNHFCDALTGMLVDDDVVWVHDYHLMLLPNLLSKRQDAKWGHSVERGRPHIIFFLHIPFPTSQIFRSLTRGPELLQGMVGADVVGFHAFEHARHFLNACTRLMGLSHQSVPGGLTGVEYHGRTVTVVVRHVSIEPVEIAAVLDSKDAFAPTASLASVPRSMIGSSRTIFASIDSCQRLSGLALKLLAFERFLWEFEQWRGQVTLIQIAIREGKRLDDELRTSTEVCKLVHRINAAFPGAISFSEQAPASVALQSRVALWSRATTLIGTAIREGLNLAPFEFIFVRQRPLSPGLILASEFSATASLLNGALRLNPFDLTSAAAACDCALSMPCDERTSRHARDLPYVLSRPSGQWTREIMGDMWLVSGHKSRVFSRACVEDLRQLSVRALRGMRSSQIQYFTPLNCQSSMKSANRRLVFSDLRGTVVERRDTLGIYLKPSSNPPIRLNERVVTVEALQFLNDLSNLGDVTVHVVTSATMSALMMTLGDIPRLGLAATNGLCESPAGVPEGPCQLVAPRKRVCELFDHAINWKLVTQTSLPVLKWYTARTNGSFTYIHYPCLAWSYYRTDPEWGRIQANQLMSTLSPLLLPLHVMVVQGKGMIEIVPRRLHKGIVMREEIQ